MTPPSPFDQFFSTSVADSAFGKYLDTALPPKERDAFTAELQAHQDSLTTAAAQLEALTATFATDEAHAAGVAAQKPMNAQDPLVNPATPQNAPVDPTPKTGDPKSDTLQVTVEHFARREGKPFGFEAIAGMDELKRELKESFIEPLRFKFLIEALRDGTYTGTDITPEHQESLLSLYAHYEKFQISIPTGLLFYGPPGTGKTYITKKLTEELGAGFISKSVGEFGSSYLHQTSKNIRDFFAAAKAASATEPVILFLDEIDSLVSARTGQIDANKAEEVSQFLQEINDLSEAPNLILIAATNRPDHLDSALLRSGRLDKKFYIGPPDDAAREALFRIHIEKEGRPHAKLDYAALATATEGFVSADIEAICDEVSRDASRSILESAMALSGFLGAGATADPASITTEAIEVDNSSKSANSAKSSTKKGASKSVKLPKVEITMADLRKTILETPSSLANVDMKLYDEWRKTQEKVG